MPIKYKLELKRHIVEKVLSGESRICDLSKQYDITEKRISIWVCKERKKYGEISSLSKEELLEQNLRLSRKIERLSEDNEILVKATALLSQAKKP